MENNQIRTVPFKILLLQMLSIVTYFTVRLADLVTMLWYWKGQAREMALSAGMERERKREDMV